jgi:MraZ protein
MNMLTGEFRNTLDEKGRISLPARLRGGLPGSSLVLTKGVERCVWIFPPDQWDAFSAKLSSSTGLLNPASGLVKRRIISPALPVDLDRLGRLSIPPSLREWAGLSHECVILGLSDNIEIWDAEIYARYLAENEDKFLAAAAALGGLTL